MFSNLKSDAPLTGEKLRRAIVDFMKVFGVAFFLWCLGAVFWRLFI